MFVTLGATLWTQVTPSRRHDPGMWGLECGTLGLETLKLGMVSSGFLIGDGVSFSFFFFFLTSKNGLGRSFTLTNWASG